jgi:GMP synthase (glutamine-hydrolysing)
MRLLVVEGNAQDGRARQAARGEVTYGESYSDLLRSLAPGAVVDICLPTDPGANIPDADGLSGYDGVAITGSALNIYDATPECTRQVDLARAVFEAGVPFFGSCWGLQVAATAAGGAVRKNPRGREIGLARKITLTEAGRSHPLHAGKGPSYDAPSIHTDEVGTHPEGMVVTASNATSEVQAAEIRYGKGVFWGVQYHPEFTLGDIAAIVRRYGPTLMEEGRVLSCEEAVQHATALQTLSDDPNRVDLAWQLGVDGDVLDSTKRTIEIRNWIEHMVRPAMSARVRA